MKSFIITTFSVLLSLISYAQTVKDDLKKLNIYEYYHKAETDSMLLNPDEISISPFSTDDINPNFSNTNDLTWLGNIPKSNKVILIGETHYSNYIHNIISRAIFGINKTDYYPLIIFENQYSKTPFVNYYLGLTDDSKAKEYFNNTLTNLINTKDDSTLYEHIRNWNKLNPNKKIEVGFSDIEHNSEKTFSILKPYFAKLHIEKKAIDSVFNLWPSDAFFDNMEAFIGKAEKEKIVGDFPFIDIKYIKNVVSNLRYTYYFYYLDENQLTYYRAKGIIHNLTDENVFGKTLKNSKVIIWGGGYHASNHIQYPIGGNFFREGSYLNFEFTPTKGKTYSIMIESIAFTLGKMAGVSLENKSSGYQYREITTRLKKAYNQKLIDADKPYFAFNTKDEFLKMVAHFGFKYGSNALLVNSCNWEKLIKNSKNSKDLQDTIDSHKKEINQYDQFIFIPYSPIDVLRERKPN